MNFDDALNIARRENPSPKTIYVVTEGATMRAREVLLISALDDAISFIEQVRDVVIGHWDDATVFDRKIEALRVALPPPREEAKSGVLADLSGGRVA